MLTEDCAELRPAPIPLGMRTPLTDEQITQDFGPLIDRFIDSLSDIGQLERMARNGRVLVSKRERLARAREKKAAARLLAERSTDTAPESRIYSNDTTGNTEAKEAQHRSNDGPTQGAESSSSEMGQARP